MAELNPDSKFSLSLKEIIGAVVGLSSLFGIYFTLQSSVAANTEDIDALKTNSVNPVDQLQKIDERLYQISKQR
jgi:hypothetical protein